MAVIQGYFGAHFYQYATDLFVETGHMATSTPEFCDHSSDEFVFLDVPHEGIFTAAQRARIKQFFNVSKLFDITFDSQAEGQKEIVSFFSIELSVQDSEKSQAAYEIHSLIHPLTGSNSSVCLFLHEEYVLLSITGFEMNCVLSDWYSIYDDLGELKDRLSIGLCSLDSARQYVADIVYNTARYYYISPPDTTFAFQRFLPIDFLQVESNDLLSRDEINEIIRKELFADLYAYGDEYVENQKQTYRRGLNAGEELMLLMLEIETQSSNSSEESDTVEDTEINNDDEAGQDEYEYSDVDPELFKDPRLLVQWLEGHDSTGAHDKNIINFEEDSAHLIGSSVVPDPSSSGEVLPDLDDSHPALSVIAGNISNSSLSTLEFIPSLGENNAKQQDEKKAIKRKRFDDLQAEIKTQQSIISDNKSWFGTKAKARKRAQERLSSILHQLEKEFPEGRP